MARKRKTRKFNAPELLINRELSWLEFNHRVLEEGLSADVPPMERLKFLAIVSSNLDEFFMIRVAGLMQQRSAGVRKRDPSGMTPTQQLAAISQRVHRMVARQSAGIRQALADLRGHGLSVLEPGEWTPRQREFLRGHFEREVAPILTPLAIQELSPAPLLPGLALNVALLVSGRAKHGERLVVVPVPSQLPRFVDLPPSSGVGTVRLEDLVAVYAGSLLPGCEVLAAAVFRITRDADVPIEDDDAQDLLAVVEAAVIARRRRAPVRLAISTGADRRILTWLVEWLGLSARDVYEVDGMLDAAALMELALRGGFDALRDPVWPPQPPRDLAGADDLYEAVAERDVLLVHPYESFDPVVQMVERAADDPGVAAVKITLYRTSGDSPIIRALARAAQNGKQVTALVELKARFDEARNVRWARRLEDAGCHVIYGVAGYKTHSKALLVVRRESGRIRRYVHLATGNYNDRTARLYSDIGLMTSDEDVGSDVAAFFNLLTGFSEEVGWSKLTIAPTGLRRRFEELIDREIRTSTPERPGLIMAKMNSLQDKGLCRALYAAAQAGVDVRLNVRGICCLRPGVKGASERISVVSIVDRYLEHARIFYFRNGGHEELYLSSADWMRRNLDRRLELLFPVTDARLCRRLVAMLETYLADNVKGWRLRPDGTYERPPVAGKAVRAQEVFYHEAVEAAREAGKRSGRRFRPLTRPEE